MAQDETSAARTEAIDLIMNKEIEDTAQLAERLLTNPWFSDIEAFARTLRALHETARYTPQASYERANAEQAIQDFLTHFRKNAAFF